MVAKYPRSFTLQQYGIVLYCMADSLGRFPDERLREALIANLKSDKEDLSIQ